MTSTQVAAVARDTPGPWWLWALIALPTLVVAGANSFRLVGSATGWRVVALIMLGICGILGFAWWTIVAIIKYRDMVSAARL